MTLEKHVYKLFGTKNEKLTTSTHVMACVRNAQIFLTYIFGNAVLMCVHDTLQNGNMSTRK